MKLVRIFAHDKNQLLSIQFDESGSDEFRKAFNQWQDVEYLEDFFETNKEDLQSDFYGKISVEDAVLETLKESREFEEKIRHEAKKGANYSETSLNDIVFKPLNKYETKIKYQQSKAYGGLKSHSWLRIYAIRISANIFVVSGSAIKLTEKMEERDHTKEELKKLNRTAQFLKNIGFEDEDDFGFIEINN